MVFEVLDKEPTILSTVLLYSGLAAIAAVMSLRRWWLGLLVVPVVLIFAIADIAELHDAFVGPAILHEGGYALFLGWHAAILIGITAPIISAVCRKHRSTAR